MSITECEGVTSAPSSAWNTADERRRLTRLLPLQLAVLDGALHCSWEEVGVVDVAAALLLPVPTVAEGEAATATTASVGVGGTPAADVDNTTDTGALPSAQDEG